MRTLAILCFSALLCVAGSIPPARQTQFFQQPAAGGDSFYYPTNLPTQGSSAYVWFVAEEYTTNAGMGTWPDRIQAMPATNTAGANTPNEGPALNSKRTLHFDGSTEFLIAQIFATGAQPYSWHMVCALTNSASAVSGMFGVTNSADDNYIGYVAEARAQIFLDGTVRNPGYYTTNKWMSIVVIGNGASSQLWTNGVQLGADFSPGTAAWLGLEIGRAARNTTFDARWNLAEFSVFTNTALSSANISNLFSYSTNIYGFGY